MAGRYRSSAPARPCSLFAIASSSPAGCRPRSSGSPSRARGGKNQSHRAAAHSRTARRTGRVVAMQGVSVCRFFPHFRPPPPPPPPPPGGGGFLFFFFFLPTQNLGGGGG